MPVTELHRKKLKKNLAVAGLVILFCALIWAVTMIRIAHADEGTMLTTRTAHQEKVDETKHQWDEDYYSKDDAHQQAFDQREASRTTQQEKIVTTKQTWDESFMNNMPARQQAEETRDNDRMEHVGGQDERREGWWSGWVARQEAKPQ